jgi:integrase
MNFAVRMNYIEKNPFDYVEFPRRQKEANHAVKQNFYDLDEFRTFVAKVTEQGQKDQSLDGYWIKGRAFLITLIATGLRRSELLTIKWGDIDFENQTLTVQRALKRGTEGVYVGSTKTAAGARTVYLDDMAIEFLRAWQIKQRSWFVSRNQQAFGSDMWVFTHRYYSDRMMSENTPRRWMVELTEAQDIRRITLHGLRHTKATLLAEAGANPRDIAAILGHTNATFTMAHYVHPTNTGIAKAEKLFNGFIKSK